MTFMFELVYPYFFYKIFTLIAKIVSTIYQ